MVKDREAWRAAVHGVSTVKHGCVTEQQKGITIEEWLENVLIEDERWTLGQRNEAGKWSGPSRHPVISVLFP